jgi:hypothetical protein
MVSINESGMIVAAVPVRAEMNSGPPRAGNMLS